MAAKEFSITVTVEWEVLAEIDGLVCIWMAFVSGSERASERLLLLTDEQFAKLQS